MRKFLSGLEKVIYRMKKIRLLPVEVHFVVGGGLLKNKVKGGSL